MARGGNRDIRNLLAVLGSAVVCATLLAVAFIYYYGPSGRYIAGNMILDPAIIQSINYQENDPRTGQKIRFLFDRLEFSYFDKQKGEVQKGVLPIERYQKFYNLIAAEISLQEVTHQIEDLFIRSHPTVLITNMRRADVSGSSSTFIFQLVQFVQEDYFRVQLRAGQGQGEWIYFYKPHLYQDVMDLFTSQSTKL